MPKTFTSTTFSNTYKDDYNDSAGYYKVLFNSGRALQARELNQLQTVIQEQIRRMADNIFLDGAAVDTSGAGVFTADYVILEALSSGINIEDYVGVTLQGPSTSDTSGLQFTVVHAVGQTDDGDYPTLYGIYTSANQAVASQDTQTSQLTFAEADLLQDIVVLSGGSGVGNVTVRTQPGGSAVQSIGKGLLFGTQSASFWTQGYFVLAHKQLIAISKYDTTSDVDVGFRVVQDIVTNEDDESLYDNQGVVPNISAPGADRYRIRLFLTARSEVADPYEFVFYASVRDGKIAQVKGGEDQYNMLEKRMAIRHSETHGDFVANPFDIRYQEGDSEGILNLIVAGNVSGLTPTAFVDGFRVQNITDQVITVQKPTSFTEEDNTSTSLSYKNYVNSEFVDSGFGNWTTAFNVTTQTRMALVDSADTELGYGRVKHIINTLDDSEGYRVHFYDVKMKAGQNFRSVKKMRPHGVATEGVKLSLSSGNLYVVDPEVSTGLHAIPGGRVRSIFNANYTVQRQFTATATGGSLSITTQSNESFDDRSRWVFINTTNNTEVTVVPGNITDNGADPMTATVTGLVDGDYVIYAYVQKNAPTQKTKTYDKHTTPITATRVVDSGGDRFVFDLYDGLSLVSARADSANGRDVSDLVTFDGGQRDNYYGPVELRPAGLASGITTILAEFEYLDWGASGDYFSVNSYTLNDSFGYSDVPRFVSPRDGETYDLRNHIDFRPKLDPYADNMVAADRFETPRDGDTITYDVQWYNRRVDNISIGYNAQDYTPEIRINQGVEALQAQPPEPKSNELVLFSTEYGGNTLSSRDISVFRHRHKRYRMSDINKLENRVETLEETVSLSFLEQEAVNLVELDSDGNVRSKTGFFVDDFKKGFNLTASEFEPTWIEDDNIVTESLLSLDKTRIAIAPKRAVAAVQMLYDSDDAFNSRIGTARSNVVRKGDVLYLDYTEVLDSSMVNEVISWYSDGRSSEEYGYYNVNPFNVFTGEGFVKLSPASDVWSDNYHLPDKTVYDEDVSVSEEVYPNGPSWNRFKVDVKVDEQIVDIEEDVIAYSVPYARQREIFVKAQGLRPNTRYWPFFDRINVEQWCIAETVNEYRDHLNKNDHLKGYPEVDVTILQHPRRSAVSESTLISDTNGELYISFWLPNNAPVPSPNGNSFNTIEEWETWIDEQRRAAETYNGVTDPQVYDDIGWKFRSGSVEFMLNDVSTSSVEDGLSNGRTIYAASGSLNVSQRTIHMTRTTTTTTTYYKQDPLAQSIMIDGRDGLPGAFVTKVDVFMRKAPQTANRGGNDLAIPLQLQVREMENGVPKGWAAGEQYRVYKNADDVYDVVNNISNLEDIDDVLSNPVTFEFEEPVYLQANTEYAIVLMAECDEYEAFISTTYGLVLGKTEERVNQQPATGSLFLSQNGSTWTPRQDQNLAYRIYTAKFASNGSLTFHNGKYPKYNHNTSALSVEDGDLGRFRVNQVGHGLGVGDTVGLLGLDSSASYLGIEGARLMDASLVVDSADVAGYFVSMDSNFAEPGVFGADSAETNQAFYFDRGLFAVTTQEYPKTSIAYTGNFITGVSHSNIDQTATGDPRFDFSGRNINLRPGRDVNFSSPRMLANPSQEFTEISPTGDSAPSIVIGATLNSTTTSTFGGPLAVAASSSGYVSDVSPIIDLQRAMFLMENYLIDNQPIDSSGASEISNTPYHYVRETHPTMGSGPSKHLTKPVVLNQPANGMRVLLDIYKPPAASIDLYYRTASSGDEDIYDKEFTRVTTSNNPVDNSYSPENFDASKIKFNEYSYLIGGEEGNLADFTKFQLKIVMRSTNTSEIPIIKSVRAIALI